MDQSQQRVVYATDMSTHIKSIYCLDRIWSTWRRGVQQSLCQKKIRRLIWKPAIVMMLSLSSLMAWQCCHDNLQCHQWRQSSHHDKSGFSVSGINGIYNSHHYKSRFSVPGINGIYNSHHDKSGVSVSGISVIYTDTQQVSAMKLNPFLFSVFAKSAEHRYFSQASCHVVSVT